MNRSTITQSTGQVIGIFFSSGDLGDVGRHAVAAALEFPSHVVARIRVFSKGDVEAALLEGNWKCNCSTKHHDGTFSEEDRSRLEFVPLDCAKDDIAPELLGVDSIVSCLGSRQPFHRERIVKEGTERLVQAALKRRIKRFVMISSVGIADDWPPMHWSQEGRLLEGFFRTICWIQYQDLMAAEMSAKKAALQNPGFDFLIVRPVALPEQMEPQGTWRIQIAKHEDHPTTQISKMDCARLMIIEAIYPSLSQRAVVLGGDTPYDNKSSYKDFADLNIPFFDALSGK